MYWNDVMNNATCNVNVLNHMYIMCNYTDVVWIGQPDVNEQLASR